MIECENLTRRFPGVPAQTFTFDLISNGSEKSVTVSVGGSGALTESQVLSSLNSQLSQYGIGAAADQPVIAKDVPRRLPQSSAPAELRRPINSLGRFMHEARPGGSRALDPPL